MSAVQEAMGQRERALRRLLRWPWRWPLLTMPTSLIVYVLVVLACDMALIGWELAGTPPRPGDLLPASRPACRGTSCPPGGCRSLCCYRRCTRCSRRSLSALSSMRERAGSRSTAGYSARPRSGSAQRRHLGHLPPGDPERRVRRARTAYRAWLTHPSVVLSAVACAVVFAVVNAFTVAVAAHLAEPGEPIAKMLWDRETLLLDLTETCVGILVAVTCALSYLLLLVALPPVILLQRSLMHQQLAAAARTDPKTDLLNATAWQREADAEVARAQRTGSPLALLLVDVDHFKRVNDSHGHRIGDEVLRALATELRQQVRESDVVGRFGGEEFTCCCRARRRRRVRDRRTAARQRGQPERGRGDTRTRPTRASTSRSRSGSRCSAITATTCSSCSRPPTWRCTGPRTPAAIGCTCTPTPREKPKEATRRTRQRTRARRLDFMPEFV